MDASRHLMGDYPEFRDNARLDCGTGDPDTTTVWWLSGRTDDFSAL
ncbi:hypothetical protein AB0F96_09740 [Streptomyces sp. NPDC023998]